MPAPVPITIRYGQDPSLMGGLAQAAGAAAYQQSQAQIAYQNWLQRRALDNQITVAALNRSTQLGLADMANDRAAQQNSDMISLAQAGQIPIRSSTASPTMRPSIGQASGLAKTVREQTPMAKALEAERLESAQLRNDKLRSSMNPQQDMVDEPSRGGQTAGERNSSMTVIGRGANEGMEWTRGPDGRVTAIVRDSQGNAIPMTGPEMTQGMGVSSRSQAQVPKKVADQLDFLNAVKGQIPDDKWNALWVTAQSGQMKMDQLVDDVRQANPKAGPKPVEHTVIDAAKRSQFEIDAIDQIRDPKLREAAMRQKLQMQDTFTYPIGRVNEAWAGAKARNGALIPNAMQNEAMSGGAMQISSDEEYDALPPGSRYVGPDGVERIK